MPLPPNTSSSRMSERVRMNRPSHALECPRSHDELGLGKAISCMRCSCGFRIGFTTKHTWFHIQMKRENAQAHHIPVFAWLLQLTCLLGSSPISALRLMSPIQGSCSYLTTPPSSFGLGCGALCLPSPPSKGKVRQHLGRGDLCRGVSRIPWP